ncbi:MAG: RHH-type proline utilization regulon transcriptional repressor/proline dehydrogenase [Gammaproteobacteria bacterium]
MLERAANLFESNRDELIALCVLEAGRTLRDSTDEVREAVDFFRYYAAEGRKLFAHEHLMPGPTGESNQLRLRARGVFVCISPWNFPIAIFVGQIAAALIAGNTVIAKPAEQTSLTAWRACELLYAAGVPNNVLAFLPGDGEMLGGIVLSDARVAGVAMTGSIDTARAINRTLASRDTALATLIAETGGVNFMLADSSALPEHVVRDVVSSAFNSAGQRCSALRVLCVQEDIAPRVLELLIGFLATWKVGDPAELASDMGPVIDRDAHKALENYIELASDEFAVLYRGPQAPDTDEGNFVAPAIIEVHSVSDIRGEVFGPVLHFLRYRATQLSQLIDDINDLGYGLTVGIQSRIEKRTLDIRDHLQVGNVYVNRNMIGAVVGVQPFGGCGLSGTGPKAGGPHYLLRFATEQTFTVNTAAIGGNATLLSAAATLASDESS